MSLNQFSLQATSFLSIKNSCGRYASIEISANVAALDAPFMHSAKNQAVNGFPTIQNIFQKTTQQSKYH